MENVVHLTKRIRVSTGAGLILFTLVSALCYHNIRKYTELSGWVVHAAVVAKEIRSVQAFIRDAEVNLRSFIIEGQDQFLAPFEQDLSDLPKSVENIRGMVADNPTQTQNVLKLKQLLGQKTTELEDLARMRRSKVAAFKNPQGASLLAFESTSSGDDEITTLLSDMENNEEVLLRQRSDRVNVLGIYTMITLVIGTLTGICFIFFSLNFLTKEVIHRHEAELRIRQLNSELETRVHDLNLVNRELEAFTYSVSHDLRAPLRAVLGFSSALQEDFAADLKPEARALLDRVTAASKRMAMLIEGLLNLSRLGRKEIKTEEINLSAMATDILSELKHTQPSRDVSISVEPGLRVRGDRELLRDVLYNLLGNAWKFTSRRQGARIELGHTLKNGQLTLFVRDNGAGFDMRYADKLFGTFQRLHSAEEFEGSGIGLANVQKIIQKHGGQVWAESAVDNGATFYFTLSSEKGNLWTQSTYS